MHLGIKADALPPGTECHHIIVEDWAEMMVRAQRLLADVRRRDGRAAADGPRGQAPECHHVTAEEGAEMMVQRGADGHVG